jgi:uncharacterized protein
MRLVLDTNTFISAVTSANGPARQLFNHARAQAFELMSSPVLIDELTEVLTRDKFNKYFLRFNLGAQEFVSDVLRVADLVTPEHVPRIIQNDADDDHVLACALASHADFIVTGDSHFDHLNGSYQGIPIIKPGRAIELIQS